MYRLPSNAVIRERARYEIPNNDKTFSHRRLGDCALDTAIVLDSDTRDWVRSKAARDPSLAESSETASALALEEQVFANLNPPFRELFWILDESNRTVGAH